MELERQAGTGLEGIGFFNLLVRCQAVTTDKVEYPSDNRVSNTGGVGCET